MSVFSDFHGKHDGKDLIDPRAVFFKVFCIEFDDQPIAIPAYVDQRYLTDPERTAWNYNGWYPPPDLDWVRKELAHQSRSPMSRRMNYLHKCFQIKQEEAQGFGLEQPSDENGKIDETVVENLAGPSSFSQGEPKAKESHVVKNNDQSKTVPDKEGVRESLESTGVANGTSENYSGNNGKESEDNISAPTVLNTYSCWLCPEIDTDFMIECSSRVHGRSSSPRWFHYSCVGLTSFTVPDQTSDWYCWACIRDDPTKGADKGVHDTDTRDPESDDSDDLDFRPSGKKRMRVPSYTKSKGSAMRPSHRAITNGNNEDFPHMSATGKYEKVQAPSVIISKAKSESKRDVRAWVEEEKIIVQQLMEELMNEGVVAAHTEQRWIIISERLASRYSIQRTWTSVKNYWNRDGRHASGLDERKKKQPDRLKTGIQNKEQRKVARQGKRKKKGSIGQDEGVSPQAPEYRPDPRRKKAKLDSSASGGQILRLPNPVDPTQQTTDAQSQSQVEHNVDDIDGFSIRNVPNAGAAANIGPTMSGALLLDEEEVALEY